MIQVKNQQGVIIEQFYLSTFQSNLKLRKELYDQYIQHKISIWCSCCDDPIALSIAKRNDTIFLKNRPQQGSEHSKVCRLHRGFSGTSEHELGWTKFSSDTEHEVYIVNASTTVFSMTSAQKQDQHSREQVHHCYSYNDGDAKSESKVTLLGLMAKLNMLSWYDYQNSLSHVNQMPKDIWSFLDQVYGTSRKIKFKRKSYTSLQQCWFGNKGTSENMKFVFLPLNSIEFKRKSNGEVKESVFVLDYLYKKDNKVSQRRIKCCNEFFDILNDIQNYCKDENGNYRAIIGGFAELLNSGWKFRSISYLPIIPQGLWVESSYEKEVYTKLIDENILFYKPFKSPEYYENYVPDIYFVKSLTPEKPYIGEIFGVIGNERYTKTQSEKIALAQKTNKFDLWYWERNKGVLDMPDFY